MSITPENAPYRPAYARDGSGLYYRIGGGGGTDPGPSVDVQPPSIPTGFTTSAVSTTGFTVSWAPASDNVGVTGYEVERDGVAVATTPTTSYTVSGLPNSTPYTIRVRARDIAGNWSGWSLGHLVTTLVPAPYVYVNFTTSGAAFTPLVQASGTLGGSVDWIDNTNPTTVIGSGLNPTLSFGSVASRLIRMRVSGADALLITMVNVGFYYGDDGTFGAPPPSANHPTQLVTGVSGLSNLPNLRYFCAARSDITGFLDCTGLSKLESVECFQSHLTSINLTGCAAIIRLCLEQNSWDQSIPIDLNPVAATLVDLRCAVSRTGGVRFATMTTNFAQCIHWCTRDQTIHNHPGLSRFPALVEYWAWGSTVVGPGDGGALRPSSPALYDMRAGVGWTGLDDAARTPTGGAVSGFFDVAGNPGMTTVTMHPAGRWARMYFNNNTGLTTGTVDHIISIVNGWGTSGGELNLTGCGRPSSASTPLIAALVGRGWTVNTAPVLPGAPPAPVADFTVSPGSPTTGVPATVTSTSTYAETWAWDFGSGATPGAAATVGPHTVTWATPGAKSVTLNVTNTTGSNGATKGVTVADAPPAEPDLWSDTFNRVAADVAAMGNGWHSALSGAAGNMDGANLNLTHGGYYARLMTPTSVTLPADLGVEVLAPAATWGPYSGICVRFDPVTAQGIKCFLFGPTQCEIGDAQGWGDSNVPITLIDGFPAGWTAAGDHRLRLEVRGLRCDVFADSQHVGYRIIGAGTVWAQEGRSGLQVGFAGDHGGGRAYRSIRVFPVTGTAP